MLRIMSKLLSITLILGTFFTLTAWPIFAQHGSIEPTGSGFVAGQVLVKFRPGVANFGVQQINNLDNVAVLDVSPASGWLRLQVAPGEEALTIARLKRRGDIQAATYNYPLYALDTPDDPDFAKQWGLNNIGQADGQPDADIDAPEAWDIYTGTDNITIAVIDTGVDLDHPDLKDNLIAGFDFVNDDLLPDDDNGHGSHVAGIAAAVGDNGQGITGISWRAKIMPLKILNAAGGGTTFDLAQAINYATTNGANIINMSLGGNCFDDWLAVEEAVAEAVSAGVLLIASSGNRNDSVILCPAQLEGVMTVGATDSLDERWAVNAFQGSNYGREMDVAAPGKDIYSTVIDGGYAVKTGTSMATPHVAGLAALIWSYAPTLNQVEVGDIIRTTSDDLGQAGWDDYFGYGRINAWRAVEIVSLQAPALTIINFDEKTLTATRTLTITTANTAGITWSAQISPAVTWLRSLSPLSGTTSATAPPVQVSLGATRPMTYNIYSTTLVVTGTTYTGVPLGPRIAEIRLIYLHHNYLPILLKN